MKRSHFGGMLFLTGSLGYLIFSLYLSQNQYTYNGMTGTLAALLGNELLIPYLVFCAMGVIGFVCTRPLSVNLKDIPPCQKHLPSRAVPYAGGRCFFLSSLVFQCQDKKLLSRPLK